MCRPRGVLSVEFNPEPVFSDAEGRFELALPSSGVVRFHGAAAGFAWTVSDRIIVHDEREITADLIMDEGPVVTGQVLSPDGRPVGGSLVTASWEVPIADLFRPRDSRSTTTVTLSDGTFEFRGLPAKPPLKIWAGMAGIAPSPATSLSLEPGQTTGGLTLQFRPAVSLSGSQSETSEPAA